MTAFIITGVVLVVGTLVGVGIYQLWFATPRYSIPGIFVKKIRVKKPRNKK